MQHFYDSTGTMSHTVVGEKQNEVAMTNPLHNVRPAAVLEIYDFFDFVKAQKGNWVIVKYAARLRARTPVISNDSLQSTTREKSLLFHTFIAEQEINKEI